MAGQGDTSAVLIRDPFKLLYWLFFRGLALRRYAASIHPELDEELNVWEVRAAAGNDPRFQALCRARWWLLAAAPLATVLLCALLAALFRFGYTWQNAVLFTGGYTLGTLGGDWLRWRWPAAASRWLGWFWVLVILLGFIVPVGAGVFPALNRFSLSALIVMASPNAAWYLVAVGVAGGVAFGVAGGVAGGVAFGVAVGVAFGVAGGVAFGVAFGVAVGVAGGVAGGVAFGVAVGVAVGVAGGVAVGVAVGVAFGVAFGVAYLVAFLRLPMYLWELPRALQLSGQAVRAPAQAAALWRRQPIHYDEVIQLPLVGLDEHIAAIARSDQRACLEALADVGASLRQQRAAPRALAHILNAELRRCTTTALIGRFHSATSWLPGTLLPPTSQEFLATLNSISDDTAGALGAATRATREQQLRQQAARVHELRLALGRADQAQLRGYAEVLTQWQRVLEQAAAEVVQQRSAAGELPARYVAGGVLSTGDPAFQGRADLFSTLESLLINAPARTTPLLLGQPRTGKSSALCQLPNRLGAQVLSVYLNMEGRMTAATATGLISDLIQEIRAAGQQHPNGYSLPPVNEALLVGDPYRVFLNWLKEVQAALGPERWLLLTLDEFDRIDEAVRERGIDARIFAMLREIIEQHPRVALALSGNYTLAESDPRWREALKSVRTLPVTFLQPDEARRVFTRPAPDFPADVYTEAAIQRVLTLTGRQPFLLHLLGETLVNGYNHSRAAGVNPESWQLPIDIERVEAAAEEVLVSGDTSFASIWHWALRVGHGLEATDTRAAGRLLQALARNQPPDAGEHRSAAQDLLDLFCERDLLALESDGQYHFRIPLFASWINRQRRLPGV